MTVPPGTMLADVLMSSPMFIGDDGQPLAPSRAGFELGFDPADDPELAMVTRLLTCIFGMHCMILVRHSGFLWKNRDSDTRMKHRRYS